MASYRLKRRNGHIREPLTAQDLQALAKLGEIHPNDLVARVNDDRWVLASTVKGLSISEPATRISIRSESEIVKPRHDTESNWRYVVQNGRKLVALIESSTGQGAGLLISQDGLIVTNKHVVEHSRSLMVSLYDGTKSKACVVHKDYSADLAIVRAALCTDMSYNLSNSVTLDFEAGDDVVAIGHPRGLTFTATRGIVSAVLREFDDGQFVQTDVAMNPGNSGGPLFGLNGELLGINTQIRSDSQGLGFAIPTRVVADYVQSILKLAKEGQLSIPTDMEIQSLAQVLSPEDVVLAAVKSVGLESRFKKDEGVATWRIESPDGHSFVVGVTEDGLFINAYIATLDREQMADGFLMCKLLRWQDGMVTPRFVIDEDRGLFINFSRSSEDLDISEAVTAVAAVAISVDEYHDMLVEYLS
jgi:S1-C subfamily serine protease